MQGNETTLTIVCSWCNKVIGTKDGDGQTGETHGICSKCEKELSEAK